MRVEDFGFFKALGLNKSIQKFELQAFRIKKSSKAIKLNSLSVFDYNQEEIFAISNTSLKELKLKMSSYKIFEISIAQLNDIQGMFQCLKKLELANI